MSAITNPHRLPAIGGLGWAPNPWERDDSDFESNVEHRVSEIMDDEDAALEPLIQDAIEKTPIREAMASVLRAITNNREGRTSSAYARDTAWHALNCYYDELHDEAEMMAKKELSK